MMKSKWPPRLVINFDNNSTTINVCKPPIISEETIKNVKELANTDVDVVTLALGDTGTVNYRSSVADFTLNTIARWCKDYCDLLSKKYKHNYKYENLKSIESRGTDLIELTEKQCHKQGILFFASLRMNDGHENDEGRFWYKRAEFKIKNPEMLIGSPMPTEDGYKDWNYSWCLNYEKYQVHKFILDLVGEACKKYNLDGIELDFCRTPVFFKKGYVYKNIPVMTDLIRSISEQLQEISERKGKDLKLIVRVPPSPGGALEVGLDIETWVKEKLIDLIAPMSAGYLTSDADYEGYLSIVTGTHVSIAGGLERYTYDHGPCHSLDMLRAVASLWLSKGAEGIYLFNYDCHRDNGAAGEYTKEEIAFLKEVADYNMLINKNKCFFVTHRGFGKVPDGDLPKELPRKLGMKKRGSGKGHGVNIEIADDLSNVNIQEMILRICLTHNELSDEEISVELNNEVLIYSTFLKKNDDFLIYKSPPIIQGKNNLVILLEGLHPPANWPELKLVEVIIKYKSLNICSRQHAL